MNKNGFRNLIKAAILLLAASSGVAAEEVVPDFYKEPGLAPNRAYVNQSFNEHVDPFTGALQLHYVDIHIPGNGGFDLNIVRSYNSSSMPSLPSEFPAALSSNIAGMGWTVHFGRAMKAGVNWTGFCPPIENAIVAHNPVLELPDGSRQLMAYRADGTLVSAQNWKLVCGDNGVTAWSPDGTQYVMTQPVMLGSVKTVAAWYTTQIIDRNGNSATISYTDSSTPEIESVRTSDGRSVTFTYKNTGTHPRLIESITGEENQVYRYEYTPIANVHGQYFLTGVERPDGSRWSYDYYLDQGAAAGSYLMKQVSYPQGGEIHYTYGFAAFDNNNPYYRVPVVTRKTTSPGGTWTFAYKPGGSSAWDTTTVTTPGGTITYKHVGASMVGSGSVWMIGLLREKTSTFDGLTVQKETYNWTKRLLSQENYTRPGAFETKFDTETYAPVLAEKLVVRAGADYITVNTEFDEYGNPTIVSQRGPNARSTTRLAYYTDTDKWIIGAVKEEAVQVGCEVEHSTTREFDANGNITSVIKDGVATRYTYDTEGNIRTVTYPRGLPHTYTDYKRGIPQRESQPEGISISRAVSDDGNVTSQTDGENETTTFGYDGLNRLKRIGYPAGNPVKISYGINPLRKTATRGNLTEITTFDGFGNPTRVQLGGISRSLEWDALGRKTFESNPGDSNGDRYQYDILNRVRKITHADGTAKTIVYSGVSGGAPFMKVTDERGNTTVFSYRAYGDPDKTFLISVAAPEWTASMTIDRYENDLVKSVTQDGFTRTYSYNEKKYLISVNNPETGATTYGRDDAGNMTSHTLGGQTTHYTYDGQNRLKSTTYPAGAPGVSFSYTKTNKLKSVSSSVATRTFAYDANGNLTGDVLDVDGLNFAVGYGYDANDHLSSITYPRKNHVVNYAPDALGRPTAVSGYVDKVTFWPSGQVQEIDYANGVVSRYEQNSRLWPSSFRTSKEGSRYVDSTYAYDGTGNLKSISDAADSRFNRMLGYDAINRLNSASGPWGTGTITYDGTGNIESQSFGAGGLLTYTYDASNRLQAVSGARSATYEYDVFGDVTSNGTTDYTYDGAQNLVAIAPGDISYAYDGLNKRVVVNRNGAKTYEVYDQNHKLLVEYTAAEGGQQIEYIYLGDKRIAQRQIDNASKTAITASQSTVGIKQAVTFTATITGLNPTGSVVFMDGDTTIGTAAIADAKASITVPLGSLGEHAISAIYGGDANNWRSTSAPVVVKADQHTVTSISVSGAPDPVGLNQPVVMTVSVAGSDASGVVTFLEGEEVLATAAVVGGQASGVVAFASMGNHGVSTVYSGDDFNTPSSSPVHSIVVNEKTTSRSVLSISPNPVTINHEVTMVATVEGSNPSGSVTLFDNDVVIDSATLTEGKATFTRRYAVDGSHPLRVSYSGDASNTAAASPVVVLTVKPKATTTTTVIVDPVLVGVNRAVSLKATVTGATPTGTVTFRDGTSNLMTVALSGQEAAFTTSFSATGSHLLSATYNGDESNKESTSAPASLSVVGSLATNTTWKPAPRPTVVVGSAQTLAASVKKTGGGALPCSGTTDCYGRVVFLDGATVIGDVPVDSNGATPAVTWVPAGVGGHTLTARYVGNGVSSPSAVNSAVNVRVALGSQTTWSGGPPSWKRTVGTNEYLSAKITSADGSVLVCDGTQNCTFGVVQYLDGTTVIGEGKVRENGYAEGVSWTPTELGQHNITARFLGTTTMEPSSVAATVDVIGAEPTSISWLKKPETIPAGTGQTLGAKIALVSGAPFFAISPGKVQFFDGVELIGEAAVNHTGSSGTVNWVPTTGGEHRITARYTGSLSMEPSHITATVGATAIQTITSLNLAHAGMQPLGSAQTLTAKVQMVFGVHGNYADVVIEGQLPCDLTLRCRYGKVLFLDGEAVIGEAAIDRTGISTGVSWTPTTPGHRTITARFLGTLPLMGSERQAQVEVTGALPTTTRWVTSPAAQGNATVGVGRTLSVRVDLASGNPLVCGGAPDCYGVVRFREERTIIGEGRVAGDGTVEPVTWIPLTAGVHVITAQYMGNVAMEPSSVDDTISATGSLTTKTTWTPAPAASRTMGTAQQLLAKVARLDGGPLVCNQEYCNYGKVRFLDGDTPVGEGAVSNTGAVTPVTWAPTATGSHTITAEYSGTLKVPGSTQMGYVMPPSQASARVDVTASLATNLTWTTAPAEKTVGAAQTLVARLALNDGGPLLCDQTQNCSYGTVTILDGTTVIGEGVVNSSGVVTPVTWIPATAGPHTITARFTGTTPLAPSEISATVTLSGAVPTTTTWTTGPAATMTIGTGQQLKAKVALTAGGTLICDGTRGCVYGAVQFLDNGTVIGEGEVGGSGETAPVTWAPATSGSHIITAQYIGTTTMAASATMASVNVTGALATATTWVTVPPTTAVAGTSRALAVNVKLAGGGALVCDQTAGCSYGKVSFLDGETRIGEGLVNADGSVPSVTWTANIGGVRTITAQYQGTTPLAPSSTTAQANVSSVATATRWLVSPPASVTVGTGHRVQVAVRQASGAALVCDGALGCAEGSYGSVRLTDNGTEVAVKSLSFDAAAGAHVAEMDWVPTSLGAHAIRAEYLGTSPDLPSFVTGSSNVTAAVGTNTVWIIPPQAEVVRGTQLTLMAQVMPLSGGTLKCDGTVGCGSGSYGKIRFLDGETVLGEVDVGMLGNDGASYLGAQIQWTPASFGARTVTAAYLGTVPNAASSVTAGVTVTKVATETHWISAPANGEPGAAQNISVRVVEAGGGSLQGDGGTTPDYGTVEFFDGDNSIGSAPVQPAGESGATYLGAGVTWLPQTPGVRTVTARYSGTARNQASEVSASVEIVGDRYMIGGSVSGLTGNGFVLRNGAEPLSIGANGSFTFTQGVAPGANYSVSVAVQPTGQQCTVTNGSGTATADVTTVSVQCRSPRNWGSAFLIGNPEWPDDHDPQVAADSAGNAMVVWSSGYSYASVNRYTVGTGWGGPRDMSDMEWSTNPRAVMDAQGNGFAAWSTVQSLDYSCSGTRSNDLRVEYFPADGSEPTQQAFPAYDIGLPWLTVGPNGSVSLVGVQLGGEDCYGATYEWRYTPGSGWGERRAAFSHLDWPGRPKVVFDGTGNAYAISWSIRDQRICWNADTGSGWGGWSEPDEYGNRAFDYSRCEVSNGADAILPDFAVDSSGNMLVVYQEDNGAGWEIWARGYEGGVWLDEELIEDTSSTYALANDPHVVMDADGNAIAVWSQSDQDEIFHIWANRYTVGSGWGTPTRLESNVGDALNPQIAMDPSGNATVIWEQGDGTWSRIWSVRNVDGAWQLPETIDDGDSDGHRPQLTFDGQGNAIAVWERTGVIVEYDDEGNEYQYSGTNVWGNRYE